MSNKSDLKDWILEALKELRGEGAVIDVCKIVWRRHENDLRQSGDLFYSWQYDIRWAAQELRDKGKLQPADKRNAPWRLNNHSAGTK